MPKEDTALESDGRLTGTSCGSGGDYCVVILVRGSFEDLRDCIDCLAHQEGDVPFRIIIVDDGSQPRLDQAQFGAWKLQIEVVRQAPLGIAQARNRGMEHRGSSHLVFLDSDCLAAKDFILQIESALHDSPDRNVFQARITGDDDSVVGRIENIRLDSTFSARPKPDRSIPYIATGALVLRSSFLHEIPFRFDTRCIRGEDTMLLAELYAIGELPYLMGGARVRHKPRLSAREYVNSHFGRGYHNGLARRSLYETGHQFIRPMERWSNFRTGLSQIHTWRDRITTGIVLCVCHSYELVGRGAYNLRFATGLPRTVLQLRISPHTQQSIVSELINRSCVGRSLLTTYANADTLVQNWNRRASGRAFRAFEIVYPDGIGVGWASILTSGKWISKVTANDFFGLLCEEAANRSLRVALIGGRPGVAAETRSRLLSDHPNLRIVFVIDGFSVHDDPREKSEALLAANPDVIVVGMGQPLQEMWVTEQSKLLPGRVWLCVGGLFDCIVGRNITPHPWIRKWGLEWLFRLVHSPRKLGRRYICGIPRLYAYCLVDLIGKLRRSTTA